VTAPETVALRRLVKHVDEWTVKVQAVLANDSVADIHRLITTDTLHREKPIITDGETPSPADQSDPPSLLRASPEFGKVIFGDGLEYKQFFSDVLNISIHY